VGDKTDVTYGDIASYDWLFHRILTEIRIDTEGPEMNLHAAR
jgi:hypothetical protein